MSDNVVLSEWWRGFFYFFAFFLLHIVVWRRGPVKHPVYSLLVIFFLLPSIPYALAYWFADLGTEWLPAFMFHLFLSLNYLSAYPALEACSPTIGLLAEMHGLQRPMRYTEAITYMGTEDSVESRVRDLKHSGLIREKSDGSVELTQKGKLLADGYIWYRRLLGEPLGVG